MTPPRDPMTTSHVKDTYRDYAPPHDVIRVHANDPRTFDLADRLWEPAAHGRAETGRIAFWITVTNGTSQPAAASDDPDWHVTDEQATLVVGGLLTANIRFDPPSATATVSRELLYERSQMAARLLLEAPAATLLSRRASTVLHAGAAVGPGGAVVIRGPSGSGKSTLIAAAWNAGFAVLGDESILVARADTDSIASTVRDVTLRPDSAALIGFGDELEPAFESGERKLRLDLFQNSTPAVRQASHAATVLLGAYDRSPARLTRLDAATFRHAFRDGEIPQERWAGDPDLVADRWSTKPAYRLDGAADLPGALALLATLFSVNLSTSMSLQ